MNIWNRVVIGLALLHCVTIAVYSFKTTRSLPADDWVELTPFSEFEKEERSLRVAPYYEIDLAEGVENSTKADAREYSRWNTLRQYLTPAWTSAGRFLVTPQKLRWPESCRDHVAEELIGEQATSEDLLRSHGLKERANPEELHPQKGQLLSYKRFAQMKGAFYVLKSDRAHGESGFYLVAMRSKHLDATASEWEGVETDFPGGPYTQEEFYEVVKKTERSWEAQGAELKARTLLRVFESDTSGNSPVEEESRQASEVLLGHFNGELSQLSANTHTCRVAPEKGAPLNCTCDGAGHRKFVSRQSH